MAGKGPREVLPGAHARSGWWDRPTRSTQKLSVRSSGWLFPLCPTRFPAFRICRKLASSAGGGRSSAGRASDCGSECRGFKSHRPPQFPRLEPMLDAASCVAVACLFVACLRTRTNRRMPWAHETRAWMRTSRAPLILPSRSSSTCAFRSDNSFSASRLFVDPELSRCWRPPDI